MEEEKKEYNRQYYLKNKEKMLEYRKQYYQDNREKILERTKQYALEHREEIREGRKKYHKKYYQDNKEKIEQYRKEHKAEISEYFKTPMGRAHNLISGYNREDKKYNRGKGDLTAKWIVENIFTSKCHWCQKDDWRKLGCDRIDNSKPHTKDNVIPCCIDCNNDRGTMTYEEFLKEIQKKLM